MNSIENYRGIMTIKSDIPAVMGIVMQACLSKQSSIYLNIPSVSPIRWHPSVEVCYNPPCTTETAVWSDNCFYYDTSLTMFGFRWSRINPKGSTWLYQNGIGYWGSRKLTDTPWVKVKVGNITSLKAVISYQTIKAITGSGNNQFMDLYFNILNLDGTHKDITNQVSIRFWDTTAGAGTSVGYISDGYKTYHHYKNTYFGYEFDGFVLDKTLPKLSETVTIDLKKLIDYLINKGRLTKGMYIMLYNTGIEQFNAKGSGNIKVTNWDIIVNGVAHSIV